MIGLADVTSALALVACLCSAAVLRGKHLIGAPSHLVASRGVFVGTWAAVAVLVVIEPVPAPLLVVICIKAVAGITYAVGVIQELQRTLADKG